MPRHAAQAQKLKDVLWDVLHACGCSQMPSLKSLPGADCEALQTAVAARRAVWPRILHDSSGIVRGFLSAAVAGLPCKDHHACSATVAALRAGRCA